jgi:hypothetical protein
MKNSKQQNCKFALQGSTPRFVGSTSQPKPSFRPEHPNRTSMTYQFSTGDQLNVSKNVPIPSGLSLECALPANACNPIWGVTSNP